MRGISGDVDLEAFWFRKQKKCDTGEVNKAHISKRGLQTRNVEVEVATSCNTQLGS